MYTRLSFSTVLIEDIMEISNSRSRLSLGIISPLKSVNASSVRKANGIVLCSYDGMTIFFAFRTETFVGLIVRRRPSIGLISLICTAKSGKRRFRAARIVTSCLRKKG